MTPTLILTRPEGQNEAFAASVQDASTCSIDVVTSPLMTIRYLELERPDVGDLVLTSVNGVRAAKRLGLADGRRAWCVGTKTAELADACGFDATVGPGDANGLVSFIASAQPSGSLAHIRGMHTRGDVSQRLRESGIHCEEIIAYTQDQRPLSETAMSKLNGENPVILPLFSPRTATILLEQSPFRAPLHLVLMSDAVDDAIGKLPAQSKTTAVDPSARAMQQAVLSVLASIEQG